MRIGELSRQSGVPTKTIRYYEDFGVMPAPSRDDSGYRSYTDAAAVRLGFVKAAQGAGLTLSEIRGVLAIRDEGEAPCSHVKELLDRRLAEVSERIRELRRLKGELTRLAARARDVDATDCPPESICRIIAVDV